MNRYNDLEIIIMVHLDTKKYSKAENMHRDQSVSLCNDYVIVTTIHETYNDLINRYNVSTQLIQLLFFLNRYNGSDRKIVSSEILF